MHTHQRVHSPDALAEWSQICHGESQRSSLRVVRHPFPPHHLHRNVCALRLVQHGEEEGQLAGEAPLSMGLGCVAEECGTQLRDEVQHL